MTGEKGNNRAQDGMGSCTAVTCRYRGRFLSKRVGNVAAMVVDFSVGMDVVVSWSLEEKTEDVCYVRESLRIMVTGT